VTLTMLGVCKAGLVAVTVTPGNRPPLSSVTWPVMLLATAWPALASRPQRTESKHPAAQNTIPRLNLPISFSLHQE
jgi:hypothetical protein